MKFVPENEMGVIVRFAQDIIDLDDISMSEKMVTLVPIAQRRPNPNFVSAPSRIRPSIEISESEFEAKYADTEHTRSVSFAADGVSDPQPTTVFGKLVTYIKE